MKRSIKTLLYGCTLASLPSTATLWAQTGSIVAWARNREGQLNVPPPNAAFVAIAAVAHHSLALRADGSIEAWGETARDNATCRSPTRVLSGSRRADCIAWV